MHRAKVSQESVRSRDRQFPRVWNGLLCFTHFVCTEEVEHPRLLKRYLQRGAAIACRHGNRGFDLVIPFAYEDGRGKQAVSGLFIKVKNQKRFTRAAGHFFQSAAEASGNKCRVDGGPYKAQVLVQADGFVDVIKRQLEYKGQFLGSTVPRALKSQS